MKEILRKKKFIISFANSSALLLYEYCLDARELWWTNQLFPLDIIPP
jgi:hypothetical protein